MSWREHRGERGLTQALQEIVLQRTQGGERVNTGTAGACPLERTHGERVNTDTAGACPKENTEGRGLTQELQTLVLERTQGGRVNTGTAVACPRENTG